MQFRNMFHAIFGGQKEPPTATYYKTLNDFLPTFNAWTGDIYDNDVVRTCIDTIARNAAKIKARHVRRKNGMIEPLHGNLEYLLQTKPNMYMNAYAFLYKVISLLYTDNNAFIYIDYDKFSGKINAFYPIAYSTVDIMEYQNDLYCRFHFYNGQEMTVPYIDLVHLRRHFCKDDFYGSSNLRPLKPSLDLAKTTTQGIENAIKSSARIRGILVFKQVVRPEDMEKQRQDFVNNYFDISNNGSIAATDAKADFIQTNIKPEMADTDTMNQNRENIYRYFGVNEKIINSTYSETEWDAFYESVIEPIAIQLSLEITSKAFTYGELKAGNEIIFEANRLQYVSTKTKISLLKELSPMGLFTVNEGREIFNLAPVEGGDKRLVSLNYVNALKQDQYQLGEDPNDDGKGDDNNGD